MKTPSLHLRRALGALSILSIGLLALPQDARADRSRDSVEKSRSTGGSSKYGSSQNTNIFSSEQNASRHHYRSSRHSSRYRSSPRIGFGISFGSGGYYGSPYYGSPYYGHSSYYGPSYSTRSTYSARDVNASVQQALARRGYYRGRIDGIIGSQSRNAISRYQQDRRLRVTGTINSQLLRSLGL